MDRTIHRFAQVLRVRGLTISVGEVLDALQALAAVGLADRVTVRSALGVALVKDGRDWPTFLDAFDAFFRADPLPATGSSDHGHDHGHDDPDAESTPTSVMASQEPSEMPDNSHSHGKPVDIRDFFHEKDLASAFQPHREANRVDLSALSQELVLRTSRDAVDRALEQFRHQLEARRLHNPGHPGALSGLDSTVVDVDLSVAAEQALADLLKELPADDALSEALRRQVAGVIKDLPDLLRRYLERLLAGDLVPSAAADVRRAHVTAIGERERRDMEEVIRRLGRQMRGSPSRRRTSSPGGRIDVARTMRTNMRFDGVPFRPVMVRRRYERPRLVVLADVSLSVRNTARFTLHLVHGLQSLFSRVRTFVFVADLTEVTECFTEHPIEDALGLVFGGALLDVDANSNYGEALARFEIEHGNAVNRRTTVIVLGDGRGNGNPPNAEALETIRHRARQVIWMTPETRGSWRLGACDMPAYEPFCDRVETVRDLPALEKLTSEVLTNAVAR